MLAARTVSELFRPMKMNYEIHGNTIPHLHLHLYPRFADDPYVGGPIEARLAPVGHGFGFSRGSDRRVGQRAGMPPRGWCFSSEGFRRQEEVSERLRIRGRRRAPIIRSRGRNGRNGRQALPEATKS